MLIISWKFLQFLHLLLFLLHPHRHLQWATAQLELSLEELLQALLFYLQLLQFFLAWWRRRKPQDHFFDVPAEEDPEVHLGQLKRFSLRELQVASDNFSNRNILGRGGFGKVYKGRLADGSLVAVKRLKEERTQGGELQFQTEVEMISMAVHRNLLRLRAFA